MLRILLDNIKPIASVGIDARFIKPEGTSLTLDSLRPNISLQISRNIPFQIQCAITPHIQYKKWDPYLGIQFIHSSKPTSFTFQRDLYATEGARRAGTPTVNSPRVSFLV